MNLRLIGPTTYERFTAQCSVGLHPRMAFDPRDTDLLCQCVVCGEQWRSSDGERWLAAQGIETEGRSDAP